MNSITSLFILFLSAFSTQASPFSPMINAHDAAAIPKPTLTSRAATNSTTECWQSLSCSFTQIEQSTLSDRLAYVQYLENLFIPLNAGDQLRPFEGLINLTASAHIGKPGTWASYVIAGILEGIQRGGAIALGTTGNTSDAGNPGSKLWADFLTKSKKKQLGDRDEHDRFWSLAEEASTTYGLTTAKNNPAVSTKSTHLNRWFTFIQVYRNILRDRKAAGIVFRVAFTVVRPEIAFEASDFINWITDTTNPIPLSAGSQLAWDSPQFDPPVAPQNPLEDVRIIGGLVSFWFGEYKDGSNIDE